MISLGIITKNEEGHLDDCLESIRSAVDEIIVIDTGSKDRTIDIARGFGARIIKYKWDGDFGKARNLYIKNARTPWILTLDSDERIAKKDLYLFEELVRNRNVLGYVFPIRNYTRKYNLLQNWYPNIGEYKKEERSSGCSGWTHTSRIRLFRKKEVVYYREGKSPHIDSLQFQRKDKRKIIECDLPIHHFQFIKGESFFLKKEKKRLRDMLIYEEKNRVVDPWIYWNIGVAFFSLNNDNRAISYLKKATKVNPRFGEAYFILGMVYREKGMYEKAILNLKKVVAANPDHADAWVVMSMVYEDRGRIGKAKKALQKAIEIKPYHPLAQNRLNELSKKY